MPAQQRKQRWLPWKNVDTTDNPTCPAYGCVEIVGFEFVGASVVLHGRSATAFEREPNIHIVIDGELGLLVEYVDNQQAAQWNHCFNGDASVAAGEVGLCTFDLPAWAACVGQIPTFGSVVSFGHFYTPISPGDLADLVADDPDLLEGKSLIDTPLVRTIGEPWRLGLVTVSAQDNPGTAGWNVYYFDQQYLTDSTQKRVFVGGTPTFKRHT